MPYTVEATTLVAAALDDVLATADRATPLGEAQVAALEAAHKLLEAGRSSAARPPEERIEILREALGSARAAVVAAATATVVAHDMTRRVHGTRP
ncbi:hypothetical protein [Streptomyces sp. NPDC089919]|uniref:hypothetical protein n=1 Tax=Streptomyces sp. NPDC089919 TaxID=3155188 RepID=UPI00343913EB